MRYTEGILEGLKQVRASLTIVREDKKMGHVYVKVLVVALIYLVIGSIFSATVAIWVKGEITELTKGLVEEMSQQAWLTAAAGWLTMMVTWLLTSLMMYTMGGCIILILLSPLLGHVADRAWVLAGQEEPRDTLRGILKSAARGMGVAIKNGVKQMMLSVIAVILSLVPVIGIVSPVLMIVINAYFYGVSFADYAMDRRGMTVSQSSVLMRANRGLMTGIGAPFALLMLIPYIGQYIALFIAPALTVAGTQVVSKLKSSEEIQEI